MGAFSPSGIITITTDFGHKGPFVAAMKGVILCRLATATIVDVTHESLVYWPAEAGFWLSRCFHYFPRGSVHLAVVDPGVGTGREILVVQGDGHVFLAPDNGLLAPVIEQTTDVSVYRLDPVMLRKLALPHPSATFHGRDIFAPVGAELAAGRVAPAELGAVTTDVVPAWVDEARVDENEVRGVVITEDNFGNLITNIDGSLVERFPRPVAHLGGHEIRFCETYGDVAPGDYVAIINSFGVVEIARAERSAEEGLGLGRGAPVIVRNAR